MNEHQLGTLTENDIMINHLSTLGGLRAAALATALLAGTTLSAGASTISFDFTTATSSGGTIGNTRTYSSGGVTLTVSAVSTTGHGGTLADAALGTWQGGGLGVCNAGEGVGCPSPQHQLDNVGYQDFVVFRFSVPVDVTSVVIQPYGCGKSCTPDRDVRYFIGSPLLDVVTGMTPGQLVTMGGLTEFLDNGSASNSARTVSIGGSTTARTLVFGAPSTDADDWFKIRSMTAHYTAAPPPPPPPPGGAGDPVPAPGALALLGAALAGLAVTRRRRG